MRRAFVVLALIGPAAVPAQEHTRPIEVSGIPALNFDADEGFGYGAIVALYGYDKQPTYRWTLQPTLFLTTEGRRDYTVFFDAPSRPGNPWRYTVFAGRQQQLAAPYYGIGNTTAYDPSLEHGSTRYFYRYGRDRLRTSADVQHAVFHPNVRLLVGAGLIRDEINPTPFDSGTTLIEEQLRGQSVPAGRTNFVRAGLTYDTRDREIGTHAGTWIDIIVQRVDKAIGATNEYTRWTTTARRYQPLSDRVTFASRVLLQNVSGDIPFYALSEIQATQAQPDGLGGSSSVRGLPKDRYLGKGIALASNELRWRALDFTSAGRRSSLILSAFVDAGRVWADGIDLSTAAEQLHAGYGAGARLAFGQSFVVALDVAHSAQSAAPIYVGLGYPF
jgi:outer membrane protein assembly factor BamA